MKAWIKAARLRTLPLAISGISLGAALAYLNKNFKWEVFVPALITAILLQILSNFANDYGDYVKGTDQKAGRQDRALSSGALSKKSMRAGIVVVSLACLSFGLVLLYNSEVWNLTFAGFLLLGVGAIAAAIKYTVGKKAYAYSGLGDLFVFVFFGLVAVCGTHYLMTGFLQPRVWLAATGLGFLSASVLNVNNMRDMESDRQSGKKTLALRIGYRLSLFYHRLLLAAGFLAVIISFLSENGGLQIRSNLTEALMLILAYSPVIIMLAGHGSALNELVSKGAPMTHDERIPWNAQLRNLSLTILLLVFFYWITALLFMA